MGATGRRLMLLGHTWEMGAISVFFNPKENFGKYARQTIESMDEIQRQSLLQSIAISSGVATGPLSQQQRTEAFQTLEEFKKYQGRIPIALQLLGQPSDQPHMSVVPGGLAPVNVMTQTRLYSLTV